jgi:hypothetical protein
VWGLWILSAASLALPVPGRLLVEAPPFGSAIVAQDGRIVRLGGWYDTAWSPDGSVVAGIRGRRLAVLDDRGAPRWTRRPHAAPAQPDWSPDGRRLAYRAGPALHVVGADGRHDRVVARGLRFAGPRWGPQGQLAWADARGAVHLAGGRRSAPGPPVRPGGLQWSADGTRLAAVSGTVVRVLDPATGALVRRIASPPRDHFQLGAYVGGQLVLYRHDFTRGTTHVTAGGGTLFAGRGIVADLTPSPDGRSVLLGRRGRDTWDFRPLASGARRAVRHVTRRLNPRATGLWAFPTVRGWRPTE